MNLGTYNKELVKHLDASSSHLWILDYRDVADEQFDQYLEWLGASESKRFERLQLLRHKQKYLIGQIMLRQVLSCYYDRQPASWEFETNDYGKPRISSASHESSIHFNLSHSENVYVIAVSRHELTGVDVELCSRERRIEKIAGRHFSASETDSLLALPVSEQLDRFYALWTLKESYIKARGMGLAISLQEFGFEMSREDKSYLNFWVKSVLHDSAKSWQFWQFEPMNDYRIALAVSSKDHGAITNLQAFRLDFLSMAGELKLELARKYYSDE